MGTMQELQDLVVKFRADRGWGKYHTVQNLCLAIASETGELCHEVRWGNGFDIEAVRVEMADIAIFLLSLADVIGVDLEHVIIKKVRDNSIRYPVGGDRGSDKEL